MLGRTATGPVCDWLRQSIANAPFRGTPLNEVLFALPITVRIRACGIVLFKNQILMVRHIHDNRDYWTLPGGGVESGESVFAAAKREVLEETGIVAEPIRQLFLHENQFSTSHCVLMTEPLGNASPTLGLDPEEAHLPNEERMLREASWINIDKMKNDEMVSKVIQSLGYTAK